MGHQRYRYATTLFCDHTFFVFKSGPDLKTKTKKRHEKRSLLEKLVAFANGHTTMAPAKKRKPAAKTQANEATTTVQRSAYEDDRAQRVAENAQLLQTLDVEGSVIQQPAKEARKRSEPMRRGALLGCLVRVSTAGMCRKFPAAPTTTEPARRSGRRTTAPQLEESAELTAALVAAEVVPRSAYELQAWRYMPKTGL